MTLTFGYLTPPFPLPLSQPVSSFQRPVLGDIGSFFINFIHFVSEALAEITSANIDCWLYRCSMLGLALYSTMLIERYGATTTIKFMTTPVPGPAPAPALGLAHRA